MFRRLNLILQEFYHDLRTQKTRAFLTTFAVAWGTFSVTMLLAFGEGLEKQMTEGELNAGDKIIRIYGGSTSMVYRGLPKGRSIRLKPEDADLLKRSIPEIDQIGPCFGMKPQVEYQDRTTTDCYTVGVDPSFEELRRMYPIAGGRFINVPDVQEQRRVVFLGYEIARRLFQGEDPIGKEMKIGGFPFKVVGVMQDKFQTSMSNGPDTRRVVIPYSTFHTIWPRRHVWYIAVRPKNLFEHKYVEQRIYEVLGQKYRFDPKDKRALSIWNSIEDE
ncbi:MAG: ABC transporter permease, partial [Calditrichaeota bacterium]